MTDAYTDLVKKSARELEALLSEVRGSLHDLRWKLAIGQLKNVREITHTRMHIARILTALRAQR